MHNYVFVYCSMQATFYDCFDEQATSQMLL